MLIINLSPLRYHLMLNYKMMNKNYLLLFAFLVVTLFSCSEEPEERPKTGEPANNFPKVKVRVSTPEIAGIDPGQLEILSYGMPHAVDQEGSSDIAHNQGIDHPAFVFDNQDRLVLAGFITQSNKELSIKSTAEYLLFMGFDMQAEGKAAREKFVREAAGLPVFDGFLSDLEALYGADPYTLDKGLYVDALKKAIAEIHKMAVPDARVSHRIAEEEVAGDVLVDGTARSYLQVYDSGLNRFRITHTARRRVKGFL